MSRFAEAALAYARAGIAVFPLQPRTKKPYGYTTGLSAASANLDLVAARWSGRATLPLKEPGPDDKPIPERVRREGVRAGPAANIGVATGEVSGFWVLDEDGPEASAKVAEWEAEYGALPPTATQSTGRGRHRCFAWDADGPEIRNRSKLGGADVDVRGNGGYIVAPPSVHPGDPKKGIPPGRVYAWSPGLSPEEVGFARAPEWLVRLVAREATAASPPTSAEPRVRIQGRATPYGEAALDNACRRIAEALKGTRDTTLYRTSCSIAALVAGGQIERGYAREELIRAGRVHVPDAMTEAQLERQVDRALTWGESRPRAPAERPREPRASGPVQAPAAVSGRAAPAARGGDLAGEARALWEAGRSAWVTQATDWLRTRGLDPGALPDGLARMRAHPNAPWGRGGYGPALLAPMIRQEGDPVEALAVLPLHPECPGFACFVGVPAGRVVALTPLEGADPLIVALDLQDAWRLASDAVRRRWRARAVVAPFLSTFAGGALGDRYGRIDPDTPSADPAAPPWRLSGQGTVYLAVRRDLHGPELRARAYGGGTRRLRLEGEPAARFYGGLAQQAWSRTDGDFEGANDVRLLAPAGSAGFNSNVRKGA